MTLRWTVLGTLFCVIFSVGFSTLAFWSFNAEEFQRSLWVVAALSVMLAGPLFFFLTTKLRKLSRLNHRLHEAVSYEDLTQVLNRGAFSDAVKSSIQLLSRGGRANSPHNLFVMVDVDFF